MTRKYTASAITLDVVADALRFCRADDRDEWIQMGMAIRAEFGDSGFDVWHDWSKSSKDYKSSSALASWKSFKKSGISIGTLIDKSLQNGFKFEQKEINPLDQKRLDDEYRARQIKRKKEQDDENEKVEAWRLRLSDFLISIMDKFDNQGTSDYLCDKKVSSFGLLFPREPMVIVADEEKDLLELHFGFDKFNAFFNGEKEDRPKFRMLKKGSFAVPLLDIDGRLWNLQIIYKSGQKSFFPGKKQDCFHIIGNIPAFGRFNLCQTEGYTNGAAIHMALDCPVVVAFDSGNLWNVAKYIRAKYTDRIGRFAFCADDDQHLVADGKKNVGLDKATAAAKAVGGFVVIPHLDTPPRAAAVDENSSEELDILLDEAKEFIIETQKVSISAIQRKFRIGYNRAARIVGQLETLGFVSAVGGNGRRTVLINKNQDEK
ncbi:MAG: PriCT-2 domain-containing protein [Gammaproteobacteria bacterium]|nr:PriCT-2 domain-containing protein [Gammaproteobacteria bacterium]